MRYLLLILLLASCKESEEDIINDLEDGVITCTTDFQCEACDRLEVDDYEDYTKDTCQCVYLITDTDNLGVASSYEYWGSWSVYESLVNRDKARCGLEFLDLGTYNTILDGGWFEIEDGTRFECDCSL
jgi:hypothetical protein